MTIFRFADNLALRVGRRGVWIYAPDVSAHPIHLDTRVLRATGLPVSCGTGDEPARAEAPDPPPRGPRRIS